MSVLWLGAREAMTSHIQCMGLLAWTHAAAAHELRGQRNTDDRARHGPSRSVCYAGCTLLCGDGEGLRPGAS